MAVRNIGVRVLSTGKPSRVAACGDRCYPPIAGAATRTDRCATLAKRWVAATPRTEAVEHARARLQQASGEAVEALREVMTDQDAPHASRVSAARTVLDMAMRATSEEEIEKRLAALEARAARKGA